jgi:carboxylesterase type B
MFFRGFLATSLVASLMTTTHGQSTVSITINNGTIVGTRNETSNVDKFLGIPYAQPPINDLRLRQAVPIQQSFGTLRADAFGASCYGARNPSNSSEDCLTLNIWRPAGVFQNETLPVLVWIYGGGFMTGYTVSILLESVD